MEVRTGTAFFTSVKPISRRQTALQLPADWRQSSLLNTWDRRYLELELREYLDSVAPAPRPLWNRLFAYPTDVFSHTDGSLDLHVNPVVVLGAGKDSESADRIFENYRGLEIRGTVDQKVSFYTQLTENQARLPAYVRSVTDSTLAVPYEGFWKQYGGTGIDLLRAQAYIDFNVSRHISTQFGFGKHFIGDGRRSLILSDFGNNYPYLRLQTQVWKLQYTNLYAQLTGEIAGGTFGLLGTGAFSRKYLASHHLSYQVTPRLTIGLFESVIIGDSARTGFEVGYLNPILFYRAFEQQDGSADNALLGLDFKWNLWKHLSLYGQLVIDELIVSEVFSKSGWWGNKQGLQLGTKYFDMLGVRDLNGQLEFNTVRPYTYGHESNYTSYSHYHLPLAHPLGANFREVLASVSYRPMDKLKVEGTLLLASYGNDLGALSYGRNVLRSYLPGNRPGDYGNDLLHGDRRDLTMLSARVSWLALPNASVDLDAIFRKETGEYLPAAARSAIFAITWRWNFPARSYLF